MNQMHHVVAAKQLAEKALLKQLFELADSFAAGKNNNSLKGKVLATLFYEPSTRTRFSFEAAMLRLGGQVISSENAFEHSSAKKGETLQDSIRIVASYADCIILRHPETGAADKAAAVSSVPIINAGDGSGEHPSQALLDVYTIQKELGRLDNLNIVLVGDFLYGRTVHSLVQLLDIYDNIQLSLVAPLQLALPAKYKRGLKNRIVETTDFQSVLPEADVVYMTRVQKERFQTKGEYENLKAAYVFGEKELSLLKKEAIIMHPLPRVDEISQAVDADPRAAYFRQAQNGLYVRMALLQYLLA